MAALAPDPISDFGRLPVEKETLPVSPGIAEGVDPDNLPCLVETICNQPELSVLCGFITFNLDEWNSTRGLDNFFVGEGQGTFLAPIDGAFEDSGTLLQHILTNDLGNSAILDNVLSYHVIDIDSTQNATDLLVSLEDFECDGDLLMANEEISHTLCFGDFEKHQIGIGNRNMRNLPKIIERGIESCDATVVMHFVDQIILPPLPLKEMPPTLPNEPLPSPRDECPMTKLESCLGYKVGKSCGFRHIYQGCSWTELRCGAVEDCICTADGKWMCAVSAAERCGTFDPILGWIDDIPEGLPWGEACDPGDELPVSPSGDDGSVTSRLSVECPSFSSFGSCERFEPGLRCDYDYEYSGCTWETLKCSSIMQCECNRFQDGNWACRSESRLGCSDRRPEGLPVGGCDPNMPLPVTSNNTMVTAEASSTIVNNEEKVELSLTSGDNESDSDEDVVLSLMSGGIP